MNQVEFRKIDFHIHTPVSTCYSEKAVSPRQIVETALAAGLDAIAITDHNTAAGIDLIRQKTEGQGLTVIPGIELTTKSGHFLALFDIATPAAALEKMLDEMDVDALHRGDGAEPIPMETREVFQKVHESGGLLIAAHIERWPSGFLESKETRSGKINIHSSPYLNALEITVAHNRAQWENGVMRGYTKKYACVQGSDAHSPAEIGRRPTYLRIPVINLESIRAIFKDWPGNIAFSSEE